VKILRCVLLGGYIFLVLFLGMFGLRSLNDSEWAIFILYPFLILVCTHLLILFGVGISNTASSLTYRRLMIPAIVLSFMMSILTLGLSFTLRELIENELFFSSLFGKRLVYGLILVSWVAWSVVFFRHLKGSPRYKIFRSTWLISMFSGVAALLITLPAHIYVVTERSGCLVGMFTRFGVFLSIYVLVWAFGPGIIVLFLRERFTNETKRIEEEKEGHNEQNQSL